MTFQKGLFTSSEKKSQIVEFSICFKLSLIETTTTVQLERKGRNVFE